MATLPDMGDPTLMALDRVIEAEAALEPPRDYLGASIIGEQCERKLYYSFNNAPRKPFNAATLYRFTDGHRTEDLIIERLRKVPGLEVWDRQDDGGQIGGKLLDGKFGWHVDGIVRGLYQAPKTAHLLEVKCVNLKKFEELKKLKITQGEKQALQIWDMVYYAQQILYMELLDLTRAYMIVATPGGREMISCRTNANPIMAKALLEKARRIIDATSEPMRISNDRSFFKCKWCDFSDTCHAIT